MLNDAQKRKKNKLSMIIIYMAETDFSTIINDFKKIFNQCRAGTYSNNAKDFLNNANAINSVFSSWLFYLQMSAGQSKDSKTLINFDKADCSPDRNFQKFDLINPNCLNAIQNLKEECNAYLLTSLILTKLSDDKSENDLYNMLKEAVNRYLDNSILNNPQTSGIALLTVNSIAAAHYNNLLKKFYTIALKKAEGMAQTHKEGSKIFLRVNGSQSGGRVKKY